jgi:hypothetical protein
MKLVVDHGLGEVCERAMRRVEQRALEVKTMLELGFQRPD